MSIPFTFMITSGRESIPYSGSRVVLGLVELTDMGYMEHSIGLKAPIYKS